MKYHGKWVESIKGSSRTESEPESYPDSLQSWERNENQKVPFYRRKCYRICIAICLLVGGIIAVALSLSQGSRREIVQSPDTKAPSSYPFPTPVPTSLIKGDLLAIALQGGAEFDNPYSYQSIALTSLEGISNFTHYTETQLIQKYALLCFFYSTFGVK